MRPDRPTVAERGPHRLFISHCSCQPRSSLSSAAGQCRPRMTTVTSSRTDSQPQQRPPPNPPAETLPEWWCQAARCNGAPAKLASMAPR